MGSRAVLVVCRDADVARKRFGITDGSTGSIYTRTGPALLRRAISRSLSSAGYAPPWTRAGTWDELATDWVLIDAELMPWSAKAQELIRQQYAPTGVAARTALAAVIPALRRGRRAWRRYGRDRRAHANPPGPGRAVRRGLLAATAGRSTRSTTCASRRSISLPRRAVRIPTATTSGTWRPSPRSAVRIRACCSRRPTGSSMSPTRMR